MTKTNDIQSLYINPLTDFGFRRVFHNKELLIDFLNGILPKQDRITKIEYQSTDFYGTLEGDRKAIFDLFCTNEKGEFIIVEMQRARQEYFRDRSLFYASLPIQRQAPKGKWDFRLKAVYFVGILDFVLFEEAPDDESHYMEYVNLVRQRTGTIYSKKLNFIFVELPKFAKTESELTTNADRWLFCLRNLSVLNSRPAAVQGRVFEKLFNAAEIKRLTTEEMEDYRKSVLEYDDVRSAVDYASKRAEKMGILKGEKRGEKRGILKGRREGEKIGVVKGRLEERREIAVNCLKKGMSLDQISSLTGLSNEEISQLTV